MGGEYCQVGGGVVLREGGDWTAGKPQSAGDIESVNSHGTWLSCPLDGGIQGSDGAVWAEAYVNTGQQDTVGWLLG